MHVHRTQQRSYAFRPFPETGAARDLLTELAGGFDILKVCGICGPLLVHRSTSDNSAIPEVRSFIGLRRFVWPLPASLHSL